MGGTPMTARERYSATRMPYLRDLGAANEATFWELIDTQPYAYTHASTCTGWTADGCSCGLVTDWATQRAHRCLALNGRGERCAEVAPAQFPFCHRRHQDRAVAAALAMIPHILTHHQTPHLELAALVESLADVVGLTETQRRELAIYLVPDLDAEPPATDAPIEPAQVPTALYRHYDSDGVLLYVGITKDTEHRFKSHAAYAIWPQFAARHTGEWFGDRADAFAAEKAAIQEERPLFNKAGAGPNRDERVKQYLIERGAWEYLVPTA